MPLIRVTLNKAKSPEFLKSVSDTIYDTMIEHYALQDGDLFHIFEQLDASTFIYDRNYEVKEARTDDFMIIQIVSDARRADEKIATHKALVENLVSAVGVKPQDVTVILYATGTLEDFSLGYGKTAVASLVDMAAG